MAARKGKVFDIKTASAAGAFAAACMVGYSQHESVACASPTSERVAELEKKLSALTITYATKNNMAFVFVKPHAVYPKVIDLVKDTFGKAGISITGEGDLDYKTIDEKFLIDTHYGAIANRAVKQKPSELVVPQKGKDGFKSLFGMEWEDAVAQGKVYNAVDACKLLGVDGQGLEGLWRKLDKKKELIKFGGGFYCAKIGDIYVMNGFYMSMRAAYTTPPAAIHWFTVEWPADQLSWEDFRGKVLGGTDPASAESGSARNTIFKNWQSLGLQGKPNTGDNGVHASASPFEAMAERVNWLGQDLESDTYGMGMLAAGISKQMIEAWSGDCVVNYEGKQGSIFDQLEDMNADKCIARAAEIAKQNE
jgi:nucleoside diphosphate kinase